MYCTKCVKLLAAEVRLNTPTVQNERCLLILAPTILLRNITCQESFTNRIQVSMLGTNGTNFSPMFEADLS